MFTGIVEEVGRVARVGRSHGDVRVRIEAETVLSDLAVGDSVSVSGCCLTAVAVNERGFDVELTDETVRATAPRWQEGARVNLERALPASGRFGGHVVAGHVEGVGTVAARDDVEGALVLRVDGPTELARWWVPKGSVTVDGVSLTLVDVGGPGGTDPDLPAHAFTLWLIPHTLEVTTLGELRAGDTVNLEADVMARYAARAAALAEDGPGGRS
ncbi:MAG: riboflavin synthase [Deinococcus-Thermus bacterium]|jgi:riboflavin synthase|nr:riboflavin synthase [Deinococcota bacterium]